MLDDGVVRRISDCVNNRQNEIIAFLQRLVRFNTCNPPGNEKGMQDWLCRWMERRGFKVEKWDVEKKRPNVVGISRGTAEGRSLILNGHSDTVIVQKPADWRHPPFGGVLEDGRLYGRGSCDMKGGLAAALLAAESVTKAGYVQKGELIIESVVNEESGGFGTIEAIKRGYKADAAIVPEPSGLTICPVQGGFLWLRIEVEGLSTHTGHRWSGIHASGSGDSVNAIEKGIRIVNALLDLEREWGIKKKNPLFPAGWTTLSPNMIQTTEWPVMIPDDFAVDAMVFYLPEESGSEVKKEIEERIQAVASADPWLKVHRPKITWLMEFAPSSTSVDHEIVRTVSNVHAMITREPPRIRAFESVSDMTFLINEGGIDTLIYGPGDLRNAHCVDEYVPISEVVDTTKVLALSILDWCGYEKQ